MNDIEFRDIRWTVLVADDSSASAAAVRQAVEEYKIGTTIIETRSAEATRAALTAGTVDLAFVDVVFPDGTGLEALDAARQAGCHAFVAIMSARADARVMTDARRLKAYHYLHKPFQTRDVMRVLDAFSHVSRPRRLLVVAETQTQRRLMIRAAEQSQFRFEISEAADGVTAFEAFAAGKSEIAIVDLPRTALGSRDTARLFRAMRGDAEVVMVGEAENGFAPPLRLLPRPFDEDDIDRLMHQVVGLSLPGI